MDITELIIERLNHGLTEEKERQFKEWLNQSYTHEAMIDRLKEMRSGGHDFADFKRLNPRKAWEKVKNKHQ